MASQPTAMASRNWMLRRLIIDSIRNDPDWKGGDYTTQPKAFRTAAVFYNIATSSGTLALPEGGADARGRRQAAGPATGGADQRRRQRLSLPVGLVGRLRSVARPGAHQGQPLLIINAADDERNPPETGLTESALKQIKNARLFLIPRQRGDARPRHDRHAKLPCRQPLSGIAAGRAARGEVAPAAAIITWSQRSHGLRISRRHRSGLGRRSLNQKERE